MSVDFISCLTCHPPDERTRTLCAPEFLRCFILSMRWFLYRKFVRSQLYRFFCRLFNSAPLVFKHNYYHHVPPATDGFCKWPHCNGIKRQSLSLITHLNETHCSTVELVRQSMRRRDFKRNIISTIPPPAPLPPPVTYSEHAALHSIQARYGSAVLSDFAVRTFSVTISSTVYRIHLYRCSLKRSLPTRKPPD